MHVAVMSPTVSAAETKYAMPSGKKYSGAKSSAKVRVHRKVMGSASRTDVSTQKEYALFCTARAKPSTHGACGSATQVT